MGPKCDRIFVSIPCVIIFGHVFLSKIVILAACFLSNTYDDASCKNTTICAIYSRLKLS